MAMTKKERAEFDAALEKARILGALRWTEPVKPDLKPADGKSITGWQTGTYGRGSVRQMWSEGWAHGSGAKRIANGSASQGGISLHSTQLRALKALRHEVELESAEKLARIDKMIEDEQKEPTP